MAWRIIASSGESWLVEVWHGLIELILMRLLRVRRVEVGSVKVGFGTFSSGEAGYG